MILPFYTKYTGSSWEVHEEKKLRTDINHCRIFSDWHSTIRLNSSTSWEWTSLFPRWNILQNLISTMGFLLHIPLSHSVEIHLFFRKISHYNKCLWCCICTKTQARKLKHQKTHKSVCATKGCLGTTLYIVKVEKTENPDWFPCILFPGLL